MSNFIESLSKLPKISLETIYTETKTKLKLKEKNIRFASDHTDNDRNLKVKSPFYERNFCLKKSPCKCPYHRNLKFKKPN